ncbi:MAG: ribose-5-phosphate isomerase RpiA [Neisseriaceae bacterium]|nr:ribose-5-phosphate isomerase RpiA [Neisseriaceae bacterium]
MTQDEQKRSAAEKAVSMLPRGEIIGVGTGSTVNHFISALEAIKHDIRGAVVTSQETEKRLRQLGIPIVSPAEAGRLSVYVDGADEINHSLQMIKGGGGALLAEKIVASIADTFICIADESKYVSKLGKFPLPVEVAPFARSVVAKALIRMGGTPQLRMGFTTESGHEILDTAGLDLSRPLTMEDNINQIAGVMDNGLFARRPADVLVLAGKKGVEIISIGTH